MRSGVKCDIMNKNIVVPWSAENTRKALLIHLIRRCIMDILPQKQCTKCLNSYAPTLEYFPPEKKGKNGLSSQCRVCARKRQKKHRSKPEVQDRHKVYMKEYHSRPEVQEQQHDYRNRSDIREHHNSYMKVYARRPKAQKRIKAYYQRPEVKERINRYYGTPEQRERRRLYAKAYHSRPEIIEQRQAYQQSYYSRPEVQAHRQSWHKEYWQRPEPHKKLHEARRNRRARIKKAQGTHTAQDVQVQYDRQKGKCYWCSVRLTTYHVDHIIPLSRGGSNWPDNLVIACPPCNQSRNNRLPHEFFKGGRLL